MTLTTEPENPNDIVTFLDANGNEISNDPRWHAKRVLGETGVDVNGLQSQIAKLTAERDAAIAKANAGDAASSDSEDEPETDDDDSDESGDEYSAMKAAELKELAKTREVNIKGMTKAEEVREALRAADKAAAE